MDSADKTARSIFVGNIPYEATEEKLMNLFGQAGPVIGFRLVYDRESGKPKGYGFCEYNSAEIAQSALRNLNNIDFNGRPLRIGPAAGEQNSAEVAMSNNTSMKPPEDSQYGEKCDPTQAITNINQIIASLHPEMMYQLIKEFKEMARDHPDQCRKLVNDNPQLSYAIVQLMVRMKMMTPEKAMSLMRDKPTIESNEPSKSSAQGATNFIPIPAPQNMFMNQQVRMQANAPPMPNFHNMPSNIPFPPGMPPNVAAVHKVDDSMNEFYRDLTETQKLDALDMMKVFNSEGEKDRAILVFQVLRLTDAQIAILPEDQRNSINLLKDQLKQKR